MVFSLKTTTSMATISESSQLSHHNHHHGSLALVKIFVIFCVSLLLHIAYIIVVEFIIQTHAALSVTLHYIIRFCTCANTIITTGTIITISNTTTTTTTKMLIMIHDSRHVHDHDREHCGFAISFWQDSHVNC